MDEAFAAGQVWHRRQGPSPHRFAYRLYYTLCDIDRIDDLCAQSRWWSKGRPNLVSFRRTDYLGPAEVELGEAVRRRVEAVVGVRPAGRILMLSHWRQWGVCFNPVSFYFCLDGQGGPAFIVAEVHNTPWNQRHSYVMDCRDKSGPEYRFGFDKQFHVSPFLPMDLAYDWRFRFEPDRIGVHMLVMDSGTECFAAGMSLVLRPITKRSMLRMPLVFPLMTARVVAAIYWQALKLWFKRVPFFPHPDKQANQT